jgi:L-amino acid N-acyltransferase
VSFVIRPAHPGDAEAIRRIYNHAVRTTTATLETEERDLEAQQRWLALHNSQPYPCFVAEDTEGIVLGWASLSPYNPKPGYRGTAENSVYVDAQAQGRGIGEALLQTLLDDAPMRQIRTIIALITSDNLASIKLHTKLGFRLIGDMERVGRKFERDVDVTLMQWSMP